MNDKSAYEALLSEVCVSLGFCGAVVNREPLHVDQFIRYGACVDPRAIAEIDPDLLPLALRQAACGESAFCPGRTFRRVAQLMPGDGGCGAVLRHPG